MKEVFERIYATNRWGGGSGEGSLPIHTRGYTTFLEYFLKSNAIQSVVDLGCGDWQFSKYVAWGEARYVGYDVVSSLILRNKETYSGPNISFEFYSGDPEELPSADLLIAKDVLQHWSNKAVAHFLTVLPRYKYILVTNSMGSVPATQQNELTRGEAWKRSWYRKGQSRLTSNRFRVGECGGSGGV